jgi:hypothetical protein
MTAMNGYEAYRYLQRLTSGQAGLERPLKRAALGRLRGLPIYCGAGISRSSRK